MVHFPEGSNCYVILCCPIIRDLTLYYAIIEVAAVWLGCGQQTAKKNFPLSNFMQIQEMIPELWHVWTDNLGFHN
jgi:hypothetical protein